MQIEILTKADLLQFKQDLIEEIKNLVTNKSKQENMTYLKSKDVKRLLSCSDSTLQYFRQSGKISAQKVGGTYYYSRESINNLMAMPNFESEQFKSNNSSKKTINNYE